MNDNITLVHADAALVVVDKPAGLHCVPGRGALASGSLAERVQRRWADARVVHRLDMATSGLLLLARGAAAQRRLGDAFAARQVHKTYVAVVSGWLSADAGEIDLPLGADWPQRPRQRVDPQGGKASLTRWRVLSRDAATGCSRLALEPLTGRTHQLRVHLAAIGHPIVGDALYGEADQAPAARLMLHAEGLTLPHPGDGRALALACPAPF